RGSPPEHPCPGSSRCPGRASGSAAWHHPGMDTPATSDATLEEARTSVAHRQWDRAHELFSSVAGTGPLGPDDLDRFARAAYWRGRSDESISLREAAFASYLERDDDERAALCALTLRREHLANMQDSVAAAWLKRAEQLLEGRP